MNAFNPIAAGDHCSLGRLGAGSSHVQVGLVQLWGRHLAVPAECIREVVPSPEPLEPTFRGGSTFAGSIIVRGQVIPIVDIASHLGMTTGEVQPSVVLVLRHDGHLIGLLVHTVSGLTRVRAEEIQPFLFQAPGEKPVIGSSFARDGVLVGVIDTLAILSLPGVPHVREAVHNGRDGTSTGQRQVVILTIAGADLAIDAALVVATVPGARIRRAPAVSREWVGVIDYLDLEIPVVDDTALLGLMGRAADTDDSLVIILRFSDQTMLGLKADHVHRIIPVHPQDVRPLPAMVSARLPLFMGSVGDRHGRQSLMLDAEALRDSEALSMIANLTRRTGDASHREATRMINQHTDAGPQSYLVFRAGARRRACSLSSIAQIIPLPSDRSRLTCPGSTLHGLANHAGDPLVLVDLGDGEATHAGEEQRMVLVVRGDESATGYIVDQLDTIAQAVAQNSPSPMRQSAEKTSSFIQATVNGTAQAVTLCTLNDDSDPHSIIGSDVVPLCS